MDNQKLEYFINAAYYSNLTKAAEICHVTQATMSRQIASLEAEIGVPLFIRSKTGVHLTKAGLTLFSRATSYQEQLRDIIYACQQASKLPFPRLRIAAGPYEHLLLKEPLRNFTERYPTAEFNFLSYTYNILASRYTNRSIDFGVCTRDCAESVGNLKMHPIYSQPWQIAARIGNPFWELPQEKAKLLYDQQIVTMYKNNFEPVEKYCMQNHLHPAQFIETNFLDSLLLMLETSNCIAVVPPFIRAAANENIRMESVLDASLIVEFVVAYDPSNPNPGNKYFFDICKGLFPE